MSTERSSESSGWQSALRGADETLPAVDSISTLLEGARALDALGKNDEAQRAYLAVLAKDAKHIQALIGLAKLCAATRHRGAAKAALEQAIAARPADAWLSVAHANLATLLYDDGEEASAEAHYKEALRLDPRTAAAHQGLAVLLLRRGELEGAVRHGRAGYQGRATRWPYRGTGKPVSVLLTLSAVGGNVPIHGFLDDRLFEKWTLIPEFFDPREALPAHDLALNCIGDADRCGTALACAAELFARSPARVLNAPTRVLETARARNAQRLSELPGVVTARTIERPRESLTSTAAAAALAQDDFAWPLLLRSPGFHTGQHFVKVEGPEELASAARELPGEKLLVMQFIDTRSADGKFRKYRVMTIGGALYPLHLAISSQWKVHYLSADMADHERHRAEDAAFLMDMPGVLGPAVIETLGRVQARLGLDYGGIDFAVDAAGRVVVFEGNATMVILPPVSSSPEDTRFAYRAAPVERAQQALRELLLQDRP